MRHLKLVKALPLIQGKMAKLEEENPQRLDLYIKQKCGYLAGIRIILEEVDEVLQRDDEKQQNENKFLI